AVRFSCRHTLTACAREHVHVKLIVSEYHKILEVLRIRTGVVVKAMQRIVDTGCPAHPQRSGYPWQKSQRTVCDRIVHRGEIGRIEEIAQWAVRRRPIAKSDTRINVDVAPIGKMYRNRLFRLANLDRIGMILQEQSDLFGEV